MLSDMFDQTLPHTLDKIMAKHVPINKAYRPNAHLLYIVMHYNGNII